MVQLVCIIFSEYIYLLFNFSVLSYFLSYWKVSLVRKLQT